MVVLLMMWIMEVLKLQLDIIAGHQKKIMLAIDRLNKLKLAAKRSAQQNSELFQVSLLPADHYKSHMSPVIYDSPSKLCIGPQKSPSYLLAANNDIHCGDGESLYAAHPWSLAPHQPEMVAIHVKRSMSVQSPAIYDVPISRPGCESFHGTPLRDAFGGRITSPYEDTSVMCMRRASGDSALCTENPYSMLTPPSCMSGSGARLPYSRGSAPSTPLHITSRLTPSTVTPTKIPPIPPQRTNSVKVHNSPLLADTNECQYRPANCGSLDRMSNIRQSVRTANNVDTPPGAVPSSAATCTSAVVMSTTPESGSSGDCSTLPFANENIGTIRQRGSMNSTSTSQRMNGSDDDDDDKPVYDEYSGTVRRRGMYALRLLMLLPSVL